MAAELDGALAVALDADDLDLATSLLLVPPLLHLPWSSSAAVVWRLLDVVGPQGRDPATEALLRAVVLDLSWAPPAAPLHVGAHPTAEALVEGLTRAGSRAFLTYLSAAIADERYAAMPLLLDVAARRAALADDAAALMRIVGTAMARGHAQRPMVVQSAELLSELLTRRS
jgi:hypothetical protein